MMVFTATQARQKFFQLLDIAQKGEEAIITYKDSNTRFSIKAVKEEQKKQSPETSLFLTLENRLILIFGEQYLFVDFYPE